MCCVSLLAGHVEQTFPLDALAFYPTPDCLFIEQESSVVTSSGAGWHMLKGDKFACWLRSPVTGFSIAFFFFQVITLPDEDKQPQMYIQLFVQ